MSSRQWSEKTREGFVFKRSVEARLRLNEREVQCLQGIGEGLTIPTIAKRLGIAIRTVGFHLERARGKTATTTSRQAYLEALETGQCICPCKYKSSWRERENDE